MSAVALGAAPAALARAGDRTVTDTYPVATALCVKAHAKTLPPRLARQATAVIAACEKLYNGFPPLVTAVDGAESAYLQTVAGQKTLVATACAKPVTNHPACRTARDTARGTIRAARLTEVAAIGTFHAGVETNRTTFWTTIQTLRGSSTSTTTSSS
ncbi:MAG TPA: hypothetical protein VID68_12100 [Solirubrobacteraceae bacterium]